MGKPKKRHKSANQNKLKPNASSGESRASESLTVFWSVTVMMTLIIDLVIVAAHWYLHANPDAEKIALLKGLLLFTGSLVGAISLIVLPVLYRVRRVPPPSGLAVFGACVSVAPILAAIAAALT